jgi:hypothetical protein
MVYIKQVTYLHRIIYVGEHSCGDDPRVKQRFERIITDVNRQDPDEVLTGLLLCYDGLFLHVLEVSSRL